MSGDLRGDPAALYASRREARGETLRAHERRDWNLSMARGGLFVAAVGVWALGLPTSGLVALGIAFLVLVLVHETVAQRLARAERRVRFYEDGLARLAGRWEGRDENGARFVDPAHPYAVDLDLFGPRSLFERLCRARTRSGEDTSSTTRARWTKSRRSGSTPRS